MSNAIVRAGEISVVIPHFNQPNFLEYAILSVLEQTSSVGEIIVVDDHSSFEKFLEAKAVCDRLSVSMLRLEKNYGTPAVPRNRGTKAASYPWVAFLDADDIWHPEKIAYQCKVINEFGKPVMVSSSLVDFKSLSNHVFELSIKSLLKVSSKVMKISLMDQLIKYRTPTSSLLMPRDWILRVPFREEKKLRGREDVVNSWVIHNQFGHSLKIQIPLVGYRRHGKQISKNKVKMFLVQMLEMYSFLKSIHSSFVAILTIPFFALSNAFFSIVRESAGKL